MIQLFSLFILVNLIFSSMAFAAADLKTQALSAHNKLRALHQAPNLIWDDTLASYAQNYANRCQFRHSHSPYGENLATGYPSVTAAIHVWYREGEKYSYRNPGFSMTTGHFTQLVWRDSKRLGCGYASCNGKNGTPGNYLVCEYSPPGNVINEKYFERNVLPE